MALTGTPALTLRLFERGNVQGNPLRYRLEEVLPPRLFEVDFFSPHNPVGHRFDGLPSFNPNTRVVTATTPGVYLFQVRLDQRYIVGRLQVHGEIEGWWFGNDSITAAVDPDLAHAQPSIYAKFKPDDKGTDLVGDITGHQYVPLTSADPGKIVTTPEGRLRGVAETAGPVNVSGTFLNKTGTLPVRVADYARRRRDLFPVRVQDIPRAHEMHNIVFLGEGFRETDRARFDEIVTRTANAMFTKGRHEPYPLLEHSFNVFKAFSPSQEHTTTCGFKITDTAAPDLPEGFAIPYNDRVGTDDGKFYTMEELVAKVGLPMRGESRQNLPGLWSGQSLDDFHADKVNPELLDAWKAHQSVGILHARDTFFGLQRGGRWADRSSGFSSGSAVLPPAGGDVPGPGLSRFVARLYEFYRARTTRLYTLDPRRHAPQACAVPSNETDPGNLVMSYLKGLEYERTPFPLIGPVWAPDDAQFKPSRGMVVLIVNDGLAGGASINNTSMTTASCNSAKKVAFAYADPAGRREMRRTPKAVIDTDFDDVVNTVAHELGHSFNLQDEYEDFGGDAEEAGEQTDNRGDNVARLGFVRLGAPPSRKIDPSRVKWLALPRMRLSDRLIAPTADVAGGIEVTVGKGQMAKWAKAKTENAKVHLRRRDIKPWGQQLPLGTGPAQVHEELGIASINEAAGTMVLTGPALPPPPRAVFEPGSTVFVALKDDHGHPLRVVEEKVLAHLGGSNLPLNSDPDTSKPNKDSDGHVSISGFKGPCKGPKLIGVYEGAVRFAGGMYRPAGDCKMRDSGDAEFCFVCKWLIVNRVEPGHHAILSEKLYPKAKKRG